jgi:hypothetical protein
MMARRAIAVSFSLFPRKLHRMNRQRISRDVYDLANSADPIAPLVREALDVIDCSLDSYGWDLTVVLPCGFPS